MSIGLTPRQRAALDAIERAIRATGIAPSRVELAGLLGLKSRSCTNRLVNALVERGHLVRRPYRARGIALAPLDLCVFVPIVERDARGRPCESRAAPERACRIDIKTRPAEAGAESAPPPVGESSPAAETEQSPACAAEPAASAGRGVSAMPG